MIWNIRLVVEACSRVGRKKVYGMGLLLEGKTDEALPHLHWVAENGNKLFFEYLLARAELSRLND